VSYSITFVCCEPGLTASQTLEWLNTSCDGVVGEVPLALTQDQETAWHLTVERAAAEFGPADHTSFDGHLELSWSEPRVQLEYAGSSASITVPYWYRGAAAVAAVEKAYGIGRVVESMTGLQAIDAQTGGGLAASEAANAVAAYIATSEAADALRKPGGSRHC
jgi:hypothetical protein